MVAQDGRHRGHHLGEPNHELDLAAAATCDLTFGPDALALRRIERGGHEYVMPIHATAILAATGSRVCVPIADHAIPSDVLGMRRGGFLSG
jgi:hypothetical protein